MKHAIAASRHTLAAGAVAALAWDLYRRTLLPGLDLGDTASFQLMAGSPVITPRDGYPLYFAIGDVVMWATGTDGARALNLTSAFEAALACAVLVLVASELCDRLTAAVAAALLFAGSYTFWSQAVIAEVYALHLLLVGTSLLMLLRWEQRPTSGRLAIFFAVYALGFGNHLSMILLAPGFALFILLRAPRRWRDALAPSVVALAVALAAAGSLQYLWNIRALWLDPHPPRSITEGLTRFWFDVTKVDWRETMLLRVPRVMGVERLRMYVFDLLQQFGWAGPALAVCGALRCVRQAPWRGALMLALYSANVMFALSYNVGDSHVFLLPSHLFVALLMACGIALLADLPRMRTLAPLMFIGLAAVRIWHEYPALDRSEDMRPTEALQRLTQGLADRRSVLLADLNWQLENGLRYFAKSVRPELAWARMPDVLLYAPALIRDNLAIGRDVALTERARDELESAYGPVVETAVDPAASAENLAHLVETLPSGTRYVLSVLRPSREFPLDQSALSATLRTLTGNRLGAIAHDDYSAVAGLVGYEPTFALAANRPFRASRSIGGVPVEIRLDCWLAFDTIRRMGFGHVVAARHHTLILERGISFVAFDDRGRAMKSLYASSLFAPEQRYLVRALHLN